MAWHGDIERGRSGILQDSLAELILPFVLSSNFHITKERAVDDGSTYAFGHYGVRLRNASSAWQIGSFTF